MCKGVSEQLDKTKRKDWIDVLRSIAIIMVVLVHTIPSKTFEWYVYNVFIGPIMIPLFFVISGYLFNPRNGNQKVFFTNLFRKLILPSLILFVCAQAVRIPFSGIRPFVDALIGFLSGKKGWYITACIIAEILFFYNLKFCKKQVYAGVTAIVCCAIGFLMNYFDICHFWMINRAFIAQFFLVTGYLFRKNESLFRGLRWPSVIIGGLVYLVLIAGTFVIWPQQSIDVHLNRYYNIPYCFVLILIACLFLLTLASRTRKVPEILSVIGQHTLVIYLFHNLCTTIGYRLLPISKFSGIVMILSAILITIFTISACTVAGMIINRFFPWIMGRSKATKVKPQP